MALAPPPPLHIAASPVSPLFVFITLTRVVTIRAPEAPSGWPSETDPPKTFTFSSLAPVNLL